MSPEFEAFPKIPRYSRGCTITEKIDGTNAQIRIADDLAPITLGSGRVVPFMVGSRTRWIFPENDNFGFAKWAYEHADEILKLGPGRHFGEWWGAGIQRRYGLAEKKLSLFNTRRWRTIASEAPAREPLPGCVGVVPVLYEGLFTESAIEQAITRLATEGSVAAPGFMDPEGIVVFHHASGTMFKRTCKNDEQAKGASE